MHLNGSLVPFELDHLVDDLGQHHGHDRHDLHNRRELSGARDGEKKRRSRNKGDPRERTQTRDTVKGKVEFRDTSLTDRNQIVMAEPTKMVVDSRIPNRRAVIVEPSRSAPKNTGLDIIKSSD